MAEFNVMGQVPEENRALTELRKLLWANNIGFKFAYVDYGQGGASRVMRVGVSGTSLDGLPCVLHIAGVDYQVEYLGIAALVENHLEVA